MPEQPRPIVTELALADALDRLVTNLIEELRADADLHVEITTDETDLVKLAFSGTVVKMVDFSYTTNVSHS